MCSTSLSLKILREARLCRWPTLTFILRDQNLYRNPYARCKAHVAEDFVTIDISFFPSRSRSTLFFKCIIAPLPLVVSCPQFSDGILVSMSSTLCARNNLCKASSSSPVISQARCSWPPFPLGSSSINRNFVPDASTNPKNDIVQDGQYPRCDVENS